MKFLPLLLACLCLTGCSTLSTHKDGDLAQLKRIYVEHLLTDNHRLDEAIVAELTALGYDASCGPITMLPEKTDAIITYQQRSAWDFKTYLIEMSLVVKGTFSDKVLATGHYYQPSVTTKTPNEVVHAIVKPLFPRR